MFSCFCKSSECGRLNFGVAKVGAIAVGVAALLCGSKVLAGESRGKSVPFEFSFSGITIEGQASYDAKSKTASVKTRVSGKVLGQKIEISKNERSVKLGENLKIEKEYGRYPLKVKFVLYLQPEKHGLVYSGRVEGNNKVLGSKKGTIRW
jgi:hypothetical protein